MEENYTLVAIKDPVNGPGLPLESQKPWYDEKLGTGWNLPIKVTNGGFALASGFDHLHQSIIQILLTPLGSRVMRPWFGSNLWKYIDSPINRRTLGSMRAEIFRALKEEPRGSVVRIEITNEKDNPQWLLINITMRIENEILIAFKYAYDRDLGRWEGLN